MWSLEYVQVPAVKLPQDSSVEEDDDVIEDGAVVLHGDHDIIGQSDRQHEQRGHSRD